MVTSSRVKDKDLSTYYILQQILEKNVIFQSGVTDGSLELVLQVFTVLSKYPAYSKSAVSIISSIHPRDRKKNINPDKVSRIPYPPSVKGIVGHNGS